jgi:hypothetical protein
MPRLSTIPTTCLKLRNYLCITSVELTPDLIILAAVCGIGKGESMPNLATQTKVHCSTTNTTSKSLHTPDPFSTYYLVTVLTDVAKFVWDCLNRDDDEDELLGLLGNQTPLRDCRTFFDIGGTKLLFPENYRSMCARMFCLKNISSCVRYHLQGDAGSGGVP